MSTTLCHLKTAFLPVLWWERRSFPGFDSLGGWYLRSQCCSRELPIQSIACCRCLSTAAQSGILGRCRYSAGVFQAMYSLCKSLGHLGVHQSVVCYFRGE